MHLQPEEPVLAPVRAPAVAADPVLGSEGTQNKISLKKTKKTLLALCKSFTVYLICQKRSIKDWVLTCPITRR